MYRELVSTAKMAPRILEMAMRASVEERGVAVVVIPGEIFLQRADDSGWTARPVVAARSVVRPDDESLHRGTLIVDHFATGAEVRDYFKNVYGPTIAAYRDIEGERSGSPRWTTTSAGSAKVSWRAGPVWSREYLLFTARKD